ncbi:MAG: hypothetical protein J7K87_01795 [Candidatus Aenigmarchaeota archaeon]|nr:hypothetical protein [Candidatus Aenigmarchaeota archaeon]
MKEGWQLKEEVPLFIILFILVGIVLYVINPGMSMNLIVGTAFFIAVVVTALEVIIDYFWVESKKKK